MSRYFTGESQRTADKLRLLADALGLSPTEALLRSGHAKELFGDFVRLEKLGNAWCEQDNAEIGPRGFVERVRIVKQRKTANGSVNEIVRDSGFQAGEKLQNLHAYFRGEAEYVKRRYLELDLRDPGFPSRTVVMSRPVAFAITLALASLPSRFFRRSSSVFDNVTTLFSEVDSLLIEARSLLIKRGERARLPLLLDRATKTLGDSKLSHETREAVAAEYMGAWCDSLSADYADHSRRSLWRPNASRNFSTYDETVGNSGTTHTNRKTWRGRIR